MTSTVTTEAVAKLASALRKRWRLDAQIVIRDAGKGLRGELSWLAAPWHPARLVVWEARD